jgi:hypothetical protein
VWGRRALFGEKCVLKGVAFRKTTREESQKTERKKSALYFLKHTLPTARGAKKLDVKVFSAGGGTYCRVRRLALQFKHE